MWRLADDQGYGRGRRIVRALVEEIARNKRRSVLVILAYP
jgi:hypothetical protein